MRAFSKGQSFIDTVAESFIPGQEDIDEMSEDLKRDGPYRVFSEGHLYPRLGKEDARFVLSVVEEYERLIKVLGPDKVKQLLHEK